MSLIYTTNTIQAVASFGGWDKRLGDVYNVELWNSKGQASDEIDAFEYNAGGDFSDSGLWIHRYTYGTIQSVKSLIAFGLSGLPSGATIISADLELTVSGASGGVAASVEVYKVLRPFTSSATHLTYDGTNTWGLPGLVAGRDYDETIIDTTLVSSGAYTGMKVNFDVTAAVDEEWNNNPDKILRLMLVPKSSELTALKAAKSKLVFYTGYQSNKIIYTWGGFYDTYYPNYGNNASDKPVLTIQYNVPLSILTSDGGSLTQSSEVITTGDGYRTIGYYIAGVFGDDQQYFVRNNTEAIVSDVCIWADWAKATVPVFAGSGTASMSYITCQNGEAANGSPTSQLWRMVCLSGGSSSQWSVEMDNGTYADTGTSTWGAANPSTLTCSGTTGVYTSTANTQGISFSLAATAPQINDTFTWETFANTSIPGANANSEPMLMIAPDISGGPGTYKNIQPLHTTITTTAVSGATQLIVEDETIFSTDDNVVIHNLSTDIKIYNTIASTVTGGVVNITGGVPWDVGPGFQIYQAPLSIGTLDPITWYNDNYYNAFWLAVDVPAGADTGIYMARVQVTEGP